MMRHTNIIPMNIGCQTVSDGISLLSPKVADQTALVQMLDQIRVTNTQEIEKATVQVTAYTTLSVDKAIKLWLQRSTQNLKSP